MRPSCPSQSINSMSAPTKTCSRYATATVLIIGFTSRSSLTTEVSLTESCPNLDSLNEYSLRGYYIMKINLLAYKLAKSAKLYAALVVIHACGLCVMRVFRSA